MRDRFKKISYFVWGYKLKKKIDMNLDFNVRQSSREETNQEDSWFWWISNNLIILILRDTVFEEKNEEILLAVDSKSKYSRYSIDQEQKRWMLVAWYHKDQEC